MLKHERLRLISKMVKDKGEVTVRELARLFGVAEMTIRRDLGELDDLGLAERTHGGAVLPQRKNILEPPVIERVAEEAEAKRQIAQAVVGMVRDGETLFLGSGTTTQAVAELLATRERLTVITNALTVINALATSSRVTTVVVGGFLRRDELSLVGHIAEATLQNLRVDKVIMGMRGIDPDYGLTSDHLQELQTDQAIMRTSSTIIIVADHTKFGRVAASRTGPITAATIIVTDRQAPPELVAAIRARGVKVVLV